MTALHEVRIVVTERQQVEAVVLITDLGTPSERVRPFASGPFDTPGEALAAALRVLPEQLALWHDRQ